MTEWMNEECTEWSKNESTHVFNEICVLIKVYNFWQKVGGVVKQKK